MCKADRDTGKVTDGPNTRFRCFAASDERYTATRMARWHNFELLKGKTMDEMIDILHPNLPGNARIVRIHVSGDFYSQVYFDAWMEVARRNPQTLFYAYTKSLKFWVTRMNQLPDNFKLNASRGGLLDALIDKVGLKSAEVVFSEDEAVKRGLEIDHNDSLAYGQDKSFALLLHGTQPAGSIAAKALSALRKLGKTGYGKKLAVAMMICFACIEGIPMKMWPVWGRPGNQNIISRAKYWGEKFS